MASTRNTPTRFTRRKRLIEWVGCVGGVLANEAVGISEDTETAFEEFRECRTLAAEA